MNNPLRDEIAFDVVAKLVGLDELDDEPELEAAELDEFAGMALPTVNTKLVLLALSTTLAPVAVYPGTT